MLKDQSVLPRTSLMNKKSRYYIRSMKRLIIFAIICSAVCLALYVYQIGFFKSVFLGIRGRFDILCVLSDLKMNLVRMSFGYLTTCLKKTVMRIVCCPQPLSAKRSATTYQA